MAHQFLTEACYNQRKEESEKEPEQIEYPQWA